MHSEKLLKDSIKLLRNPFPIILQTFLLEYHSKGTWTLKEHLSAPTALQGYFKSTCAIEAIEGHLGTQALEGPLDTRGTQGTLFSRLNCNKI